MYVVLTSSFQIMSSGIFSSTNWERKTNRRYEKSTGVWNEITEDFVVRYRKFPNLQLLLFTTE